MKQLDSYFEYLVSHEANKNNTASFPDYDRLIQNYKSFFHAGNYRIESNSLHQFQAYRIPFKLLGESEFILIINISRLIKILNNLPGLKFDRKDYIDYCRLQNGKDVERGLFSRNQLLSISDESDIQKINKSYAEKSVNRTDPIICGDFLTLTPDRIPPAYILDGNHRVYGKLKAGINEIDGYMVSTNIWYHALLRDIDKRFVKILSNINLLTAYQHGTIHDVSGKMYTI